MVRREIKSFELELNSGKVILDVPTSLAALIGAGRISAADIQGEITLSTEVQADSAALLINHIYVKLGRFSAPCDVLLNGTVIGRVDGERLSYLFDAKSALIEGANRLSFRFEAGLDLSDVGIFYPVEIIRFNNAIIDKVSLTERHSDGAVTLGIRLGIIGNSENVRAVATLTSPAGQMYYAGFNRGVGALTVGDPLFWWPHGHGVQNLYKLSINLYGELDIEDTVEMRVGLRTVELARSGDRFVFNVNGAPVLPMGALYRAERDLSSPARDKRIEAFVTYAAMANYNTVIIPSDSIRPTEKFYDLCDAHGIMVIEEAESISEGYLDTVARASHHPSLCHLDILDNGNVLPWAESLGISAPNLGFSVMKEFTKYPEHPSLPCERTLNSAISPAGKNPTSTEMDAVVNTETLGKILAGIIERYPYPKSLGDLAYTSQLAQANKIASAVKALRLSGGMRGRVVFDSLGDAEIIASPSAIDADARRKALGFYSQKFFAPITVYAENDCGKVSFLASVERKIDFVGTLEYRIADAKNVTVYKNSESVEIEGMSSKPLITADLTEYIRGHENEYYLEYTLREASSVIATDVLLFVPEKHFAFEPPTIYCEVTGSEKRFSVTLTPKAFAKDVELYFEGVDAVLSDNFLNLTQNSPVKVTVSIPGSIETAIHLKEALRLRSVYDVK